jgi:hypothetical protein
MRFEYTKDTRILRPWLSDEAPVLAGVTVSRCGRGVYTMPPPNE